MADTFRGTLTSIMIVDDRESILYSLVEIYEGANSTVHSVVSVEGAVEPLEDNFAAVEKIGLSTEELGDVLMKLIPDTDTLSRFRNRWNPFVMKLRMCLDRGSEGKPFQAVRTIMDPSIPEQL